MASHIPLSQRALSLLRDGGVFVPSPLALDKHKHPDELYQQLLTLYYIKAGAKAVIPGAHTGEFALNDIEVFANWIRLVKEMTDNYGNDMLLMAAIGGEGALKQAEIAARFGYDLVMVAPTAFKGKNNEGVVTLLSDIATIIPTFGFELQRVIPGSYVFSYDLWSRIFEITYGAKGASFDTYRSMVMLEAAANSSRKDELVMLTGNDDRIVADLLGAYSFQVKTSNENMRYAGGLLGHFATDTHAATRWVAEILRARRLHTWDFPLSKENLAHAVNQCNMVLFDALANFENSVWGVKYRLTALGLLPGPFCAYETGRKGQAEAIDKIYGNYPVLTDNKYLKERLSSMKKEIGITSKS